MRRVIAVIAAVSAAAVVPFAGAAPTCTGAIPQAVCGDRVVAEAMRSLTFIQYEEAFPALEAIEAVAPDVIEVYTLAEAVGDPAAVSAGGLDIPVIRITDEKVTGPKKSPCTARRRPAARAASATSRTSPGGGSPTTSVRCTPARSRCRCRP
jgi:hypothetical protein